MDEETREDEIRKILEESTGGIQFPGSSTVKTTSREYRVFQEEEKFEEKLSLYEKLCNLSERIIKVKPDKKKAREIEKSIEFAHLKITPQGAYSFAILSGIFLVVLGIVLAFLGLLNLTILLVFLVLDIAVIYYLMNYPISRANIFRVKASSEITLAVIYMVIYMRSSPNLEGAVRFTADNLSGPLCLDFRKILWDVETRKFMSVEEAFVDYLDRWSNNQDFIESVNLIRNSMEQSENKRHRMLDEAVNVILKGSRDKMQSYSQQLQMPLMLIHSMGVMLPMLVMVMFPIVILMLHESINPLLLIFGYDVILPLTILFLGTKVLEYRPFGFSAPDISLHPKYAPLGRMRIGGRSYPLWPFAILISAVVSVLGFLLVSAQSPGPNFQRMGTSMVVVWGLGLGAIFFFLMDSREKMKIRNEIKKMQEEFAEALFKIGNRLSLGKPIETVMEETVEKSSELEIVNLFKNVLDNLKRGMTLKTAFFDKDVGAIWNYPSKIVINVMKIILDATRKGVQIASISAISISRYLKEVQDVDKDLKNMLNEATTSMKFLSLLLGPMIAGVTVTMAAIMMMIFQQLGKSLAVLQTADLPGFNTMLIGGWGQAEGVIPLEIFQIIVGIYVIEVIYLLSMLGNGIENGPGDKISERNMAGSYLLIGLIVYTLSVLVTYAMFGPTIQALLAGGLLA